MSTKQVIVIRTKYPDGKGGETGIRKGKLISQGSHASMAFLTKRFKNFSFLQRLKFLFFPHKFLKSVEIQWMKNSFAKVCLQVESEEELLNLHYKAIDVGLESNIIQDSGRTEFKGVPTYTSVAIGPDFSEKIDAVTGHLKLY
jgi:PTH2 family peptidyl-tRNA hydrolase